MKILPLMTGLVLLWSLSVRAQETPKVEVFGGYSYANIKAGEERINTNGWHAMIAINTKATCWEGELMGGRTLPSRLFPVAVAST